MPSPFEHKKKSSIKVKKDKLVNLSAKNYVYLTDIDLEQKLGEIDRMLALCSIAIDRQWTFLGFIHTFLKYTTGGLYWLFQGILQKIWRKNQKKNTKN